MPGLGGDLFRLGSTMLGPGCWMGFWKEAGTGCRSKNLHEQTKDDDNHKDVPRAQLFTNASSSFKPGTRPVREESFDTQPVSLGLYLVSSTCYLNDQAFHLSKVKVPTPSLWKDCEDSVR